MARHEADVIINGIGLTRAQATTVRVALTAFRGQLSDPDFSGLLGDIGPIYQREVDDVLRILLGRSETPPPTVAASKAGG